MALDDKLVPLEQLQQLEVGNVERVIGEVEVSKHGMERVQHETEVEIEVYGGLLEEKLPQILTNIQLLGNQIFGLKDGRSSFYPVHSRNVEIEKKSSRRDFSLGITLEGGGSYNFLKFVFGNDSHSLKRISFYDVTRGYLIPILNLSAI